MRFAESPFVNSRTIFEVNSKYKADLKQYLTWYQGKRSDPPFDQKEGYDSNNS